MKFAIGDDVGQLKIITASRGTNTSRQTSTRAHTTSYLEPTRNTPIAGLFPIPNKPHRLAIITSTGGLKIIDTQVSPLGDYLISSHGDNPPPASSPPVASTGSQDGIFYVFFTNGLVRFYTLSADAVAVEEATIPGPVAAGAVFVVDGMPQALAVGGEKRDVEVYERQREKAGWKSVWKGKNVKRDRLGMQVPVHIRCLSLLPSTAAAGAYRLVAGTQHSHLRLYDTVISRRPVFSAKLTASAILSLQLHPSTPASASLPLTTSGESPESARTTQTLHWIYTDSNGHFGLYSTNQRRDIGVYKGSTGVVEAVVVYGESGVVGVGVDRYLRSYEGAARKLTVCAYGRTRGTAVAVLDSEDEKSTDKAVEKGVEEEEEDVWSGMEEVEGGEDGGITEALVKVRKRRPRTDAAAGGKKRRVR